MVLQDNDNRKVVSENEDRSTNAQQIVPLQITLKKRTLHLSVRALESSPISVINCIFQGS